MNKKNCLIIATLLTIGAMPFFPSVSAQDETIVNIHMVDEVARTHFDNPAIVAGIWHYINVTPEDQNFQNLDIKFYKGSSMPGVKNESNYYEWKYNKNAADPWTDLKEYGGYSYINADQSQKKDDTYCFCLGVKDTWPNTDEYFYHYENWTLKIYKDTTEIYSTDIVLEKPTIGLSKGHDDTLNFQVDPFSAGRDLSAKDNERDMYFTIGNPGNVPLDILVDYPGYNDIASVTNSNKKLSVKDTFDHYVTINSKSWKPGILTIPGDVIGTIPDNLIIPTAQVTFNNSFQTNAAVLEISVGHSNYTIEPIPGSNIVFQYQKDLKVNENDIKDTIVYISGQGTVRLNVIGDEVNVAILKVTSKDQTGTPLTITSTNTTEYAVTVQFQAIRENKVGIITYQLEVDGKTQTYETSITIGPPAAGETAGEGANIPTSTVVIVLLVVIVIGYMIFTQIRHKRR